MPSITPSATVDPKATLADGVEIGPGCFVGPHVVLGEACRLLANVTIMGHTTIGRENTFYPAAVIGAPPQDLKYEGGDTRLVIGDHNIFREGVTAHPGTELGGRITQIGSHNQFQVGSHIAHDVILGNHCILSNLVQIAGHVHIEDHVVISGLSGVQQFVTVGQFSFLTGMARCTLDAPPYLIYGSEGTIQGVNVKGLGRWGFTEPTIQQLRDLFKRIFPRKSQTNGHYRLRTLYGLISGRRDDSNGASTTLARRLRDVEEAGPWNEHCRYLIDFLKRSNTQGVHGRFLESLRRDGHVRAQFYAQDESLQRPQLPTAPAFPGAALSDGSTAR